MSRYIKLLIVDDEPQNTQILQEIFSFHPKYECKIAMSGEEALKILEGYFPDIVLLDIMMPELDGYEVCRQIRASNKHRFTKIVMISGRSMIGDRLKGYSVGADDYIAKPFIEDELLAKLEVFSKLNRMEEVDQLKSTALNILSHETRTPLNGIVLGSDLLYDIQGLPDQARRYIEMIRESGLRIQTIIEKISRYCTLKDGLHLNRTDGRIDESLENIMRRFKTNHKVKIKIEEESDLAFVADWELLEEAFFALLESAAKNTDPEGVLTIEYTKNADGVKILFKDQGAGVDPASCERIFDGLYSPDLLHHRQGTGLSLAIAKEIIEEHGGKILFRNRREGGSEFEVRLNESYGKDIKAK